MTTTISKTTTTTAPHVRLTTRGRALVLVALVALLFGTFSFGRANSEAAPAGDAPVAPAVQQTVIQPGESLWTVARRIAPDNDPRTVVAQIRKLNDMAGSQVQAGQHLLLPIAA